MKNNIFHKAKKSYWTYKPHKAYKLHSFIFYFSLLYFSLLTLLSASAQEPLQNHAFAAGERLDYQLYFNWKFIWLKAGTAYLEIKDGRYNNQDILRATLLTKGNKRTDRFFMMRDTIVSYLTPELVPLFFRKGAREGKRYYIDEVWYDYPGDGNVHLRQRYTNNDRKVFNTERSVNATVCDMLSMLIRARTFDATNYREGQKIHFKMADGDRVSEEVLIYRGKKKFKMDDSGITYRCLVFSSVWYDDKNKEREVITFYITDDLNHIPVRLDMYLRFGTAKAFLRQTTGLRNPQTSIIIK